MRRYIHIAVLLAIISYVACVIWRPAPVLQITVYRIAIGSRMAKLHVQNKSQHSYMLYAHDLSRVLNKMQIDGKHLGDITPGPYLLKQPAPLPVVIKQGCGVSIIVDFASRDWLQERLYRTNRMAVRYKISDQIELSVIGCATMQKVLVRGEGELILGM